jgi:hypothetical protein
MVKESRRVSTSELHSIAGNGILAGWAGGCSYLGPREERRYVERGEPAGETERDPPREPAREPALEPALEPATDAPGSAALYMDVTSASSRAVMGPGPSAPPPHDDSRRRADHCGRPRTSTEVMFCRVQSMPSGSDTSPTEPGITPRPSSPRPRPSSSNRSWYRAAPTRPRPRLELTLKLQPGAPHCTMQA